VFQNRCDVVCQNDCAWNSTENEATAGKKKRVRKNSKMSIDQIRFVMAALLSAIILQHPSTIVHTLDICNNSTSDLKPAIIACWENQHVVCGYGGNTLENT